MSFQQNWMLHEFCTLFDPHSFITQKICAMICLHGSSEVITRTQIFLAYDHLGSNACNLGCWWLRTIRLGFHTKFRSIARHDLDATAYYQWTIVSRSYFAINFFIVSLALHLYECQWQVDKLRSNKLQKIEEKTFLKWQSSTTLHCKCPASKGLSSVKVVGKESRAYTTN